ncbi:unnamed protein product [Leptosia nina]|uniref:Uncharacterized protein n=1 Tax=Leptosia nina TaxID=320188 RepID=A0AAV1J952_9NEOP
MKLVLTFRGTVVRRSRAQHHSAGHGSNLIRRRRPHCKLVLRASLDSNGKIHVTSTSIRHSRYRRTAVAQQENQRAEISMNDIMDRLLTRTRCDNGAGCSATGVRHYTAIDSWNRSALKKYERIDNIFNVMSL